jgi:hypothetical protein
MTIDAYLVELERALPRTGRNRALREVREHLRDAASRHSTGGASDFEAESAATREFGPVDDVAVRLTAELAVRHTRIASALALGATGAAALVVAAVLFFDIEENSSAPTPVLIAVKTIEAGTSGMIVANREMYAPTTLPKSEVEDGAISDPSFLRGRAVIVELLPGEQLNAADFHP